MTALRIDGKSVAERVCAGVAERAAEYEQQFGRKATLGVVLVGEDPASKVYVASKSKKAAACGLAHLDRFLPADVDIDTLVATLAELNQSDEVDGILLQLPLPAHLDSETALAQISPGKDVDGLSEQNLGRLACSKDGLFACTPSGSMLLIKEAARELYGTEDLSGKHAVVIGRSRLVGKPVALMLLEENCTVSICHSRTEDLPSICRQADIVVAAVGRTEFVKGDWIKPGAIVIDVGINRQPDQVVDGKKVKGKLKGDVEFFTASEIAGAITPVPGGVGPMTIAMLMSNTIKAASQACEG